LACGRPAEDDETGTGTVAVSIGVEVGDVDPEQGGRRDQGGKEFGDVVPGRSVRLRVGNRRHDLLVEDIEIEVEPETLCSTREQLSGLLADLRRIFSGQPATMDERDRGLNLRRIGAAEPRAHGVVTVSYDDDSRRVNDGWVTADINKTARTVTGDDCEVHLRHLASVGGCPIVEVQVAVDEGQADPTDDIAYPRHQPGYQCAAAPDDQQASIRSHKASNPLPDSLGSIAHGGEPDDSGSRVSRRVVHLGLEITCVGSGNALDEARCSESGGTSFLTAPAPRAIDRHS
jgi:hypothetical protein